MRLDGFAEKRKAVGRASSFRSEAPLTRRGTERMALDARGAFFYFGIFHPNDFVISDSSTKLVHVHHTLSERDITGMYMKVATSVRARW